MKTKIWTKTIWLNIQMIWEEICSFYLITQAESLSVFSIKIIQVLGSSLGTRILKRCLWSKHKSLCYAFMVITSKSITTFDINLSISYLAIFSWIEQYYWWRRSTLISTCFILTTTQLCGTCSYNLFSKAYHFFSIWLLTKDMCIFLCYIFLIYSMLCKNLNICNNICINYPRC